MKPDINKIKAKIEAASEFLSNLRQEIKVVEGRRNQLQLETEQETERLLKERQEKLEALEVYSKDELSGLGDSRQLLYAAISELDFAKTELESQITAQKTELEENSKQFTLIKASIDAEKLDLSGLESKHKGVLVAIEDLKNTIVPLIEQKTGLSKEIEELTNKKVELAAYITHKEEEFDARQEDFIRERDITAEQVRILKQQREDMQEGIKAERDELATRKMAADRRDQNLRIREHKVSRDEQTIAQNAGLLNL